MNTLIKQAILFSLVTPTIYFLSGCSGTSEITTPSSKEVENTNISLVDSGNVIGTGKIILTDSELGIECKKATQKESSDIYAYMDTGTLDILSRVSDAIDESKKDGENSLFYEALHGTKPCSTVLSNSEILMKICEVMKDGNQDAYNTLKNSLYESPKDKERILGFLSKFLGNPDFSCDTECDHTYKDFIALKEDSRDLSNLSQKSSTELSVLLLNGSLKEEELKKIAIDACISSYQAYIKK